VASEREAAGLSRSLAYMAALKAARFGTANEHPDWEIGPSRLHLRHRRPPRMLKRIEGADRDGRFEAVPGILHAALALYRAISTRRMPNSWRCRHLVEQSRRLKGE
jgi:hypothetical protein